MRRTLLGFDFTLLCFWGIHLTYQKHQPLSTETGYFRCGFSGVPRSSRCSCHAVGGGNESRLSEYRVLGTIRINLNKRFLPFHIAFTFRAFSRGFCPKRLITTKFVNTFTNRRRSQPCKVTGAVRVRCLAQGHSDTPLEGRGSS